ncbi:glyoxalase/bleomycin resistance protein/dioxygenase [Caballeronia peredens]|nr:glyoxalase/bleomycin resistance protein/dioxygenase [Caballeronia peredens]
MASQVDPIPNDRRGVIPYMAVAGCASAIEFYTKVFGATETFRIDQPDGRVGHAELSIGGNVIYLCDEFPDYGTVGPLSVGGTPVMLHLYVTDVDAVAQRAVDEGATILRPVETQFYGDRGGKLRDPFGHVWWLGKRWEIGALLDKGLRAPFKKNQIDFRNQPVFTSIHCCPLTSL